MKATEILAKLETIIKDLALIGGAIVTVHDSLTETSQNQQTIYEKLAPIRAGIGEVETQARELHEAAQSSESRSKKRTKKAPPRKRR